jgi:hypothetical protein
VGDHPCRAQDNGLAHNLAEQALPLHGAEGNEIRPRAAIIEPTQADRPPPMAVAIKRHGTLILSL